MFDNFGFENNIRNKFMKECKFNTENAFLDSYDIIPNQGNEIYFDVEEVEIYALNINSIIICEYNINKDMLKQPQQILNSHYQAKNKEGKDEINSLSCEMFLNDKKILFDFKYQFIRENIYTLKIIMEKLITNMSYMFSDCSSLTSLDLSNFNTNNVTNMGSMFFGCSSLTSLDLSNLNTNSVTNMSCMFYKCSSLTSLDLSNFNTNNVKDMSYMFSRCSSLTSLNTKDEKILKWKN